MYHPRRGAVKERGEACSNAHFGLGRVLGLPIACDLATNQDARRRDGRLILPHGTSGYLRILLPVALPGRLMEVRLSKAAVRLVCQTADVSRPQQTIIGVDLGVNTLVAATDGEKAILVRGRAAKATVQYRNTRLADCQEA